MLTLKISWHFLYWPCPRVGEGMDYSSSSLGTTELWAGLSGLSLSNGSPLKGGHMDLDLEKELFGLIPPLTSMMQWFL